MVFPLVAACIAAVLYIVIGMYQSLSLQASLHISVRDECGKLSQTVYRMDKIEYYPFEKGLIGIRQAVLMEKEKEYQINILFKDKVVRKETGRSFLIDEAELIRILPIRGDEPS